MVWNISNALVAAMMEAPPCISSNAAQPQETLCLRSQDFPYWTLEVACTQGPGEYEA